MSWKTRKKGTTKQRGKKFKTRSLFFPAKHLQLADIVRVDSVPTARKASAILLKKFKNAKTRRQKRKIKQAMVCAANRVAVTQKKKDLSQKERKEMREVEKIYRSTYKKMILPPRKFVFIVWKKGDKVGKKMTFENLSEARKRRMSMRHHGWKVSDIARIKVK